MRYFRNFAILIVLVLSLIVSKPAMAQTPTPSPCSPDAPLSTPCPVKYDTTNVVIQQSQTWVSSLINNIALLLGTHNFDWIGSLRPLDDQYTIGSKKFTDLGQQIQQSSENELKPAALQVVTTPDMQPKPFTMTSVVCIRDPQTGTIKQVSSADRIESKDIPGLTQTIEGSRQLGSYVTGYTQTSQDYNLKGLVVSTDIAACDIPSTGQNIEQTPVTTQNQNSYSGNSIVTIIQAFISQIQGLFQAKVTQTAEIQGKGLTPWEHYALCLLAGCTSSDVSSVTYDPNKEQVAQAGGAVAAMYKPAAIDDTYKSELNAANPEQKWNLSTTGNSTTSNPNVQGDQSEVVKATAVNYGQARITAAGDYMNCTLLPAGLQGPDCDKNWVSAESGTTGGGWNCDTSVPAQSVPGVNMSTAQSFLNRWFNTCPNAEANAWQQCANDVVATAKKSCVDPLFALAIWIHESGASNYQCSELVLNGQKVEDFGIHNSLYPPENLSVQLDKFVQLPSAYVGNCPQLTLQNFLARFGPGVFTPSGHYQCYNELSQANKNIVDTYINELKLIYAGIAPGISLPTWPGVPGCTGN